MLDKCTIAVGNRTFISMKDGKVCVEGHDFHSDLRDIKDIIDILTGIVATAKDTVRPRLVTNGQDGPTKPFQTPSAGKQNASIR